MEKSSKKPLGDRYDYLRKDSPHYYQKVQAKKDDERFRKLEKEEQLKILEAHIQAPAVRAEHGNDIKRIAEYFMSLVVKYGLEENLKKKMAQPKNEAHVGGNPIDDGLSPEMLGDKES